MGRELYRAQELWESIGANFERQFQRVRELRKAINTEAVKMRDENTAWMKSCGLIPVHDAMTGGYTEGFDRNSAYQFMRVDWDAPEVFKLADCDPMMCVGGLYYRPSSKGRV